MRTLKITEQTDFDIEKLKVTLLGKNIKVTKGDLVKLAIKILQQKITERMDNDDTTKF